FEEAGLGAVWILYVIRRAWAGAFHLKGHSGDALSEKNVRSVLLFGLRGPLVADGGAIGLKTERAGDLASGTIGRLDVRVALGEPAASGRGDFEFFMANGLSAEFYRE